MIFSIVLGVAIFGYAGYSLVKFVNKSKKGKCAACSLNEKCSSSACE